MAIKDLDEAIKHCLEKAETQCGECKEEHIWIAERLKELKELRKIVGERHSTRKEGRRVYRARTVTPTPRVTAKEMVRILDMVTENIQMQLKQAVSPDSLVVDANIKMTTREDGLKEITAEVTIE